MTTRPGLSPILPPHGYGNKFDQERYLKTASGLEVIDVIEAFVRDKPYRWSPLKYLFRAGKKPGQDEIQDLRKAIWWVEREIASIEAARQKGLEAHVAKIAERAPPACPDLDQEFPPNDSGPTMAPRSWDPWKVS